MQLELSPKHAGHTGMKIVYLVYSYKFLVTRAYPNQVTNMDEAVNFIDDLKDKFRAQGQQIITYRRKLRQQVEKKEFSLKIVRLRPKIDLSLSFAPIFEGLLSSAKKVFDNLLLPSNT